MNPELAKRGEAVYDLVLAGLKGGTMKNNNGKGLYDIGEREELYCGCVIITEEIGCTQYVHPACKRDNKVHPAIKNYRYAPWWRMPDKE